jgi:hypothetical protein
MVQVSANVLWASSFSIRLSDQNIIVFAFRLGHELGLPATRLSR